jgi:hypothetical protein
MMRRSQKDRLEALNRIMPVSRSARFLRRQSQPSTKAEAPDWATLIALPRWTICNPSDQNRIAMIAALLYARRQIDQELSGQTLSALAALVGENAFDAICDAPIDQDWPQLADGPLPAPAQLLPLGMRLLQASLPHPLQVEKPFMENNSASTLALVAAATDIASDTAVDEPEALDVPEDAEMPA